MHGIEAILDRIDEIAHALRRQEIRRNQCRAPVGFRFQQKIGQGPLSRPTDMDDDARTAIKELPRHLQPDAAPGTCHDHVPILKKLRMEHGARSRSCPGEVVQGGNCDIFGLAYYEPKRKHED